MMDQELGYRKLLFLSPELDWEIDNDRPIIRLQSNRYSYGIARPRCGPAPSCRALHALMGRRR
ncbi:hypothetical protein ACSS6W_008625 [Trichoderma asperelloides]